MIRKACFEDLDKIVEMKIEMFKESGHLDLLKEDAATLILSEYKYLYENGMAQHFVAEAENEIIACAGAFIKNDLPYCFFSKPYYGFLGDVYTEPSFRRRNLARSLVLECIAWLKDKDISTIRLLASQEAYPLYESLGFKTTDEMILSL